jgi:hypothetical protein
MHNEPGYPLKGWYVAPRFSLHPEIQAFVKPDYEPFVKPEAAPYMRLDMEDVAQPVMRSDTDASRKKSSKRPKSESEADRYLRR